MKFGASTFIWASPFSSDALYLFDKVASMGYSALEVCIEDPALIDANLLRKASEQSGVVVLICGAFGPGRDISDTDAMVRQAGVSYIKTCIDIARAAGAELVSGPMYAETGKIGIQTAGAKAERMAFAVENMKIVADYAKDAGIKLAVEPLNRFETDFLNTVTQGLAFFDRIAADNVGFLLDTFHMNIEEKNIPDAIRLAGDKIFNFHACGNDRGAPGADHIDWDGIKEALQAIDYDGHLVVESFNTDVKEIARAVSLWRPLAESADALALDGIRFLQKQFA